MKKGILVLIVSIFFGTFSVHADQALTASRCRKMLSSNHYARHLGQMRACQRVLARSAKSQRGAVTARALSSSYKAIPQLGRWETQMKTYGAAACNQIKNTASSFDSRLAATLHDAEYVYQQIFDYTKLSSWKSCAAAAESVYRDGYVLKYNGNVPGYWNFSEGLTQDYLRSGDMKSKSAAIALAENSAFARDQTPSSDTVSSERSVEVANAILSYLNEESLGQARRTRLALLVDHALGHIDQWFVTRSAAYVRPSEVAVTAYALLAYNARKKDRRVLPALARAADGLWNMTWLPASNAFRYTDRVHSSGGTEPAPDLNLLIAPFYGWLYYQTGEIRFRDRGDAIFAGGVTGAYLGNSKQFNQNYRWSFSYIRWRLLKPLFLSIPTDPTPPAASPTATMTPTSTQIVTPGSTPTTSPTATRTPPPVATATSTPTNVPPTINTPTPTRTATPASTRTVVPPTATPTRTNTPTATATPSGTPQAIRPIPRLAQWESQMLSYGQTHCQNLKGNSMSFDQKLNATYYDAEWVFFQIADYTHDTSWYSCAQAAQTVYGQQYVIASNGFIPGYWNFSHGLTQSYLRTGDTAAKNAEILLATNAAFSRDSTQVSETVSALLSREVAYAIMGYLNAEDLGQPRRARLQTLVNQAFDHLNQWTVAQSVYVKPFMVSLTAHALISYYDRTGDSRVIPALTVALDWLWDHTWVPSANAFMYIDRVVPGEGDTTPAADLNLLIAPAYAWIYYQTGEPRFLERADAIFSGGVQGAWLSNGKQFDQSYRWSFEFVKWRQLPPLRTP